MSEEEILQHFHVGQLVYSYYMGPGPAYRPYQVAGHIKEIKDSMIQVISCEVPNTTLDYDFALISLDAKESPVIPAEMVIENEEAQ